MICIFHRSSLHTAGDVTYVRVEGLLVTFFTLYKQKSKLSSEVLVVYVNGV
jgi:hypothetical protein